ncbi:hypothetical protein [Robinsoniella peoriensis]|uniref:hypothetical protein n=1 Tax=Robinsoniella peoriensis TaxID=180332 RepID=UPI0037520587
MRYQGLAEIEMTNVEDGTKEVICEENMVTNAVTQVFRGGLEALFCTINSCYGLNLIDSLLPIAGNAIGGILLFKETLEENPDKIYVHSATECIGYASNNVNPTENQKRGSLNLTESIKLDNGFKYVWDFTTSQGNGTIGSLCLTHKGGGAGFYGDGYDNESKVLLIRKLNATCPFSFLDRYLDIVEIDFENEFFYSISMTLKNEIIIKKLKKRFLAIGINDTPLDTGDVLLDSRTLTPTVFTDTLSNERNVDFFDGKDGYWYGFMGADSNRVNAEIKWMKIQKETYSFTEGKWVLPGVTMRMLGRRTEMNTNRYLKYTYCVIRNGYLYFMNYDRNGVYKLNANNSADITLIQLGFKAAFEPGAPYGYLYMYLLDDWIMGSDFSIDSHDRVCKLSNKNPFQYVNTPLFQYGPYLLGFGKYTSSETNNLQKSYWLLTPYLATINNLSNPVIKTADKTMKITYFLTETNQ